MKESKYIIQELKKLFPDAKCELSFTNPYTLLVSVILSAQCTDKRVNQVTPELFKKYPTVYDLAKANQSDVEMIIKSCGFYNNKAKNSTASDYKRSTAFEAIIGYLYLNKEFDKIKKFIEITIETATASQE